MNEESTLQIEIERIREALDIAAARGLDSEECFQLSLKLDRLIEQYYDCCS